LNFDSLPNPIPLPKELGGLEVLVNDRPVPIYFISPGQINYLVPFDIPSSGEVEVQVVRRATGQVLAAGPVRMNVVAPALFAMGGFEDGPLAALNQDLSVNTPANPVGRGQIITLFGTGFGDVASRPAEGTPPSGAVQGNEQIRVVIGSDFVRQEDIQYFGLAPGLVGVYQINVRVPEAVAPNAAVPVAVQVRSINTNRGVNDKILSTTISVRQ
jgi:uncharacterized protein (TIGR03437 family)